MAATRTKRTTTTKRVPPRGLSRQATIALAIAGAAAVAGAVGVVVWKQGESARIERERRAQERIDILVEEGERLNVLHSTPEQRESVRREVAESQRLRIEQDR